MKRAAEEGFNTIARPRGQKVLDQWIKREARPSKKQKTESPPPPLSCPAPFDRSAEWALPREMVVTILSFCPALTLVRWRLVCREWSQVTVEAALKALRARRYGMITFDEGPHKYYYGAKQASISVTGFIHMFSNEFNEDEVINRWYDKWQKKKDARYFGMTKEEIKQKWQDMREDASSRGTRMHANLELTLKGIPLPQADTSPEYQMFLRYWQKTKEMGWTPYLVEARLFHEEMDLAGSVDIVWKLPDGTLAVYDWKRSKEIHMRSFENQMMKYPINHLEDTNYNHYRIQINIYARLLKEKYGERVSRLAIVIFHEKNDEYIVTPMEFMHEEVDAIFKYRIEDIEMSKLAF